MLIDRLRPDCLEQVCRQPNLEARQRQCPSNGKPDSWRHSSAIPRFGMSSSSESSADRQEKIKPIHSCDTDRAKRERFRPHSSPARSIFQHRSDLITFLELIHRPEPNIKSWYQSPWHVGFRLRKIKDNKLS